MSDLIMEHPDPLQLPDAGIVTQEGFPYGLRCMGCNQVMVFGTAYCSVPEDGAGVVVCPACTVEAG